MLYFMLQKIDIYQCVALVHSYNLMYTKYILSLGLLANEPDEFWPFSWLSLLPTKATKKFVRTYT